MSIRSTVKAIILHKNKILLNKCYDKYNGEYFILPGGDKTYMKHYRKLLLENVLKKPVIL